jgi:MoaA/NifB/PqqE/SkfB family radical SAM enzyme
MADSVWNAIIEELGMIQYSGQFAFHNYNEPLADPSLFSKVAQARKTLDHAKLTILTNGDYLNRKTFKMLASSGINKIRVTLYPPNGETFEEPQAERIIRYLDRALGIQISKSDVFMDHHLQALIMLDSVELHFMAPVIRHYHNRGGAVRLEKLNAHPPRTMACFLPFLSAAIDYLGNLKLCCEIYDVTMPQNRIYNIGNILDGGFLKWWFSERMNHIREQISVANFKNLPACRSCRYFLDEKQLSALVKDTDE